MTAGPSLPEFWTYVVLHHRALKGFALEHASGCTQAVRRTAWTGLAVLASMLRRLIHLMACNIPLAPLAPAGPGALRTTPPAPRRPRLRFRLTEVKRDRPWRAPNPQRIPDTPEFDHARFLERLSVIAAAYRARTRLARRLARRVQTGRAPLRALPLPARLYTHAPAGFTRTLDQLDRRLASAPDTS
jgi:hypothetical protein